MGICFNYLCFSGSNQAQMFPGSLEHLLLSRTDTPLVWKEPGTRNQTVGQL